MTYRIQFIKDADEVTRQCRQRIAELRARIPIVKAVHSCLVGLQAKGSTPTRRWIDVLYKALQPFMGELPFVITGFDVQRQVVHMSHGYVKFNVDVSGFESLRFSVHYTNAGIQPDTALIGYAQDAAIADALQAKLPGLGAAVTRYNNALAELCDASNFAIDLSLGVHCNVHPLSHHFQWYELAGDVGKSMELRKRGIFVR